MVRVGCGGFGGSGVLGLVALVQFGPPLGFSGLGTGGAGRRILIGTSFFSADRFRLFVVGLRF